MAGILAAMRWAPNATWIIGACDHPHIEGEAVRWLLGQRRPGRWAVMPTLGTGVEPLFAIYEPQAAELIEDLAAAGTSAPRFLVDSPRTSTPLVPENLRRCWFNANTPRDLATVQED